MNVFEAFNDRLIRRLREMEGQAQQESTAIVSKMAAAGRAQSGGRIRLQLEATTAQLHRAVDWALGEAMKLPGQPFMTRQVVQPHLALHLDQYIDKLHANIRLTGLGDGIEKVVNDHCRALKDTLNAELKDFSEGIWHPRNADRGAAAMNTNNTVNIHGSNQGSVQQAGVNSNQQATFVMNADSVGAALRQFIDALTASDIDPTMKGEMQAEASTIEIQLKRSKPNLSVVQAAARGIEELAIQVGANVVTPYVVALLAMVGLT